MNNNIVWIRERFSWMGNHSGYDLLFDEIARNTSNKCTTIWRDANKILPAIIQRILSRILRGTEVGPFYSLHSTKVELEAGFRALIQKTDLIHIAYVENCLGILPKYKQKLSLQLIGTAHQPASVWQLNHSNPDSIANLEALIVLSRSDVSYFEQFMPGRVFFIPHGVDTDFFQPQTDLSQSCSKFSHPRCVFSGSWLRDIETLAIVIDRLVTQSSNIQFDMIVPMRSRTNPAFHRIARYPQVHWHSGISDEQLRELYQKANLLLLPIYDATANNAILEAMACGLPIVSNNIGGLPDYTDSQFADLFPVGDVEGMVHAAMRLIDSPDDQQSRGIAARTFVEKQFTWTRIAQQTLNLYSKLLPSVFDASQPPSVSHRSPL